MGVGLLCPVGCTPNGARLAHGFVVRGRFGLGLLRHYRTHELAITRANPVAIALHSSGVQTCATSRGLVRT
jgi:lipid-binding SYLF domain-containing protein